LNSPELYDLKADISEKYDVSQTFPETVAKMLTTMDQHLNDVSDAIPDQLAAQTLKN
jgi:hypothetical protein